MGVLPVNRCVATGVAIGGGCPAAHEPFSSLYCAMPDVGAGIHPFEAVDAFEAEQVVQRHFPGANMASLTPSMTDEGEIRRLFVDWLGRI